MSKPLRVAFISFDFGEYCVRLASSLVRHAEVMLVMPQQLAEPYLPMVDPAIDLRLFNKPRLRQPARQLRTIAEIHRHIWRFAPEVVHIQTGHPWFNLSLPLLRRDVVVLTVHDPRHHVGDRVSCKEPQWILDLGAHRANELIVHAPQVRDELVRRLRLSSNHVHVIPHVLLGDDTAQQHVSEQEGTILFFGRIWPYKGLEYLIRAEPVITREFPNARIVIAGEGEDFSRYERMMVHPENFIVYNQFVSDEKRAELFRQASVVALPYIDASQSGVIPVAYRYQKPVVATTVGGLPDSVEHGRTGFLVPPADERRLAEAILCLLRDKHLRRQFGVNGKRKVETQGSPDVIAFKTFSVYQQALSRGDVARSENVTSGQQSIPVD